MKVEIDYGNLPPEMTALNQWVCYDIEGSRKVPYTPGTADRARSNDPSTFRSFEEAVADIRSGARDHLGFMMVRDNGLVFIDLDHTTDPEEKGLNKLIFQSFPSYTERSVSGKGVHIIMRGKMEGRGLHTPHFGMFEHARGILVTGDIVKGRSKIRRGNKKFLRSLQEKVRASSGKGYDFDLEESEWDAQPWAVRSLASKVFGDKFHALIDGRWEGLGYPSQSEADHALINMFCDLTDSNSLVRYLFAESGLYREHKARMDPVTQEYSVKGYLDYTIKQNRAKTGQRLRMKETVRKNVEREVASKKAKVKAPESDDLSDFPDDVRDDGRAKRSFNYPTDVIDRSPSWMHRELALYLYKNSFHPNQEVSVASALVVMVMIAQRAWLTPSGAGLNMNLWLIAETGWGKETFTRCVDMVIGELRQEQPALGENHLGKLASGEAVETVISKQPRFMSRVSEAGAFWRKLLSQHKPPHIDSLVEAILNLFMSANRGRYWQSRTKAKKDEDITKSVFRPAGSFYGESTPEDLLDDLDINSVSTGLLQRQLFYNIEQAEYVEENPRQYPMSDKLKSALIEMISTADNLDLTNENIVVGASCRGLEMLRRNSEKHKKYAHRKDKEVLRAKLMNRNGIKCYRMAALLAVGNSPDDPVIREKEAAYAIDFVTRCDEFILNKFQSGDVGRGQLKQESDMVRIIEHVVAVSEKKRRRSYRMNEHCAADPTIIPYSYLKNKAKARASFSEDKFGAITAIDRCIESLCRAGTLVRLTRTECEEEYETTAGLLRYTAL